MRNMFINYKNLKKLQCLFKVRYKSLSDTFLYLFPGAWLVPPFNLCAIEKKMIFSKFCNKISKNLKNGKKWAKLWDRFGSGQTGAHCPTKY